MVDAGRVLTCGRLIQSAADAALWRRTPRRRGFLECGGKRSATPLWIRRTTVLRTKVDAAASGVERDRLTRDAS